MTHLALGAIFISLALLLMVTVDQAAILLKNKINKYKLKKRLTKHFKEINGGQGS